MSYVNRNSWLAKSTIKEVAMNNEKYLKSLDQEFDLEEIERKLNSTSTNYMVKANEFFSLAMLRMKCSEL